MIDQYYPNNATNGTKIMFMNAAQDELSPYFGIIVEDNSLVTVALQDSYSLPTGLSDVSQITALGVAGETTPTTRYSYTKYDLTPRDDYPAGTKTYFQTIDNLGVKKLVINPEPTTSGYPIRIRYRKALTELSPTNLSASPDFDSRFHDILVHYACYMICSTGANPDTIQADRFMQSYESALTELWHYQMLQESDSPTNRRDNKHWHKSNGYAGN